MALVKAVDSWRTVDIPFESYADEEFQFLSNIEELENYEITKPSKAVSKRRTQTEPKSKKKRKRLKEETEKGESDETIAAEEETVVSVENEKKPSKKKRKLIADNTTTNSSEEQEATSTADTHSENPNEFNEQHSSWIEFGLSEEILKALADLNFVEPTSIQKLCIVPAIRDQLDILGAAETGSGKTLAFGIPIVQGLLNSSNQFDGPQALILTPTRELAIQIKQHITAILKYTSFKVVAVVGGLSVQKQDRLLKKKPEIIVATPGRLWAMIEEKHEYLKGLPLIRYLVIDETDRMIEKGHFIELSSILQYLTNDDTKRQTFVFSATLTYVHPAPKRLSTKTESKQMTPKEKIEMIVSLTGLRKERKVIDITRKFGTAETLVETRLNCSNLEDKDTYLYYFLLNYVGRTLIFANSVNCTRRLRSLLTRLKFSPLLLHAQMHQKQRLKSLEKFSECSNSVLLATDVAARGLDIKNIEHVIHYQVPRTTEIYVHRSGRTARASNQGLSLMLVDAQDALNYRKICKNLNRDQDLPIFPVKFSLIPFLRERIKLATKLDTIDHRIDKVSASERWFSKSAREAEFELDNDELVKNLGDNELIKQQSSEVKLLQKQLNFLLNKPLPKEEFITKYPTSLTENELKMNYQNSIAKSALDTIRQQEPVKKRVKLIGKKLKLKNRKRKNSKRRKRK